MTSRTGRPDIIVDRPDGIMLVEVKDRINDRDLTFFVDQLARYVRESHRPEPAYSLLVDPAFMRFYRGTDSSAWLKTLSTPTILNHYDANFGQDPIFESYLATLVQAWLNDLALTDIAELPVEVKSLPQDLQKMLAA